MSYGAAAQTSTSQSSDVMEALKVKLPAPLTQDDFRPVDMDKVRLGRLLFHDPILSGNRNISCATCHAIEHGTSDGLSLGIGQGGIGVGPKRKALDREKIRKRIPRNSPALWNLGAKEVTIMFHDGRVSVSDRYENGFDSPAEEWLPDGLDDILAAQALFPLTSQFEMAGNPRENQVAGAAKDRVDNVWPILAKRVRVIPAYSDAFIEAFDDVGGPLDITIVHIANALSAFMNFEWRSFDSPFDSWLGGDEPALTAQQKRGMTVFFGEGNCASCHSGKLFTDHKFHALALPHFGPGRTRRFDPYARDVGRMGETDDLADAYRFRTPSLRNIELSPPYGHNGAYPTLEGIVRHHLDPQSAFDRWEPQTANLPRIDWLKAIDFVSFQDSRERKRLRAHVDIKPVRLDDTQITDLIAFLKALTGTASAKGRLGEPASVPSGLPVD
ncbi:MAG: methylamine utilization protein MauG [Ahrensia sp.]|nr:methylamine utilization protein MauG [Ahrensia sp.]